MQPPIHHGQVPHFAPIGEYYFERLCRDLLGEEPHVRASRLYGKRSQKQYGIDVRAERRDGGLDVGQCKCYAAIQPEDIRKASDDFLDHLATWWAGKGVRRFIFFIACDIDRTELQEEIGVQAKRFDERGIEYEAWSAEILREKLAPHREVARRYVHPAWVAELCGDDGSGAGAASGAVLAQNEELAAWATEWVERELEETRTAVREGRRDEAIEWAVGLRENRLRWYSISDEVRARVIRFEASVMAHTADGLARARQLVDEAQALVPSLDTSIPRALIARCSDGPAAALEALAGRRDIDHLNLRAGLLLEQGRVDECIEVLDEAAGLEPAHAEVLRLRALCHLARGEPTDAYRAAERALSLQPAWIATRYVAAILRYFSALSPVGVPGYLPVMPEPVDWLLVRQDDESVARLRYARDMFAALLAGSATDEEERVRLELWHLACLANDSERQCEAADACRVLLSAEPANYWAVTWAIARRWDVDLDASHGRFAAMLADGSAAIPHMVALVRIDLARGRATDAAEVLDREKPLFTSADAEDLWRTLRVQAAAHLADAAFAMSLSETAGLGAHALEVRAVALDLAARASGDLEPLLEHLRAHFQSPGEPELLLQYCQYMDAHRQWAAVAEHAAWLTDVVGTAEAVRLAAIALFNAGLFEQCHRLVDAQRGRFPRGQLPIQLRRIRAHSLHASRRLLDALAEAEALARDDGSAESLLHLGQLLVETGNFHAVHGVVRRLSAVAGLSPSDTLQAAAFASLNDDRTAVMLWRRAVAAGIPDEAVAAAYALGSRLGLDAELGPLTARLWDLGSRGQGGVRLAKVDELVDVIRQHRERGAHLDQVYRSGSAPVHLIGAAAGLALADPYHARLLDNEAAPAHREPFSLFVRHGGRAFPSVAPPDLRAGQLHLDVTAILLAAHVGILEAVEQTYRPLHIPPGLIGALVRMRELVAHPQPRRLAACDEVLALADQGLLKVASVAWLQDIDQRLEAELGPDRLALVESARQADGYVVDFLPLRRPDLSGAAADVPDDVGSRFVNVGAVAESLRQFGPLSASAHAAAIAVLGTEGRMDAGAIVPPPGRTIYLHGVARLLVDAGLLRLACDRFDVRVAQSEIEDARAEVAAGRRSAETVAWLDELIGRVSQGLDHGVYRLIDAPMAAGDAHPDEPVDTDTRCLLDLLQFPARPGDAVWADDRHITGYLHRDGAPVVGIYEVLAALRARGGIQDAQYYQTLHRLRAASVLFLPIEPEELLHHLAEARVEEGQVVPTRELLTIRQYVARCFLQGRSLQRISPQLGPAGQFGEIIFLRSITRAVGAALVRVWGETQDDDVARTCGMAAHERVRRRCGAGATGRTAEQRRRGPASARRHTRPFPDRYPQRRARSARRVGRDATALYAMALGARDPPPPPRGPGSDSPCRRTGEGSAPRGTRAAARRTSAGGRRGRAGRMRRGAGCCRRGGASGCRVHDQHRRRRAADGRDVGRRLRPRRVLARRGRRRERPRTHAPRARTRRRRHVPPARGGRPPDVLLRAPHR